MKLLSLTLGLLFSAQTVFAGPLSSVNVSYPHPGLIHFEYCETTDPSTCSQIGRRDYTSSELLALHDKLMKTAKLEAVAGGAFIIGTAATGGLFGDFAAAFTFGSSTLAYVSTGASAGIVAGSGTDLALTKLTHMSPLKDYQEARALDPSNLLNAKVPNFKDVAKYRYYLQEALDRLN